MLTEHDDGSITLSDSRKTVCLESASELEALGQLLGKLENDGSSVFFQVRAMAIRICNLSGVVMMAVGDKGSDTGELMETVCPGSKGAA